MENTSIRSVWLGGALKGAVQGIPLGIGIGLAAAALLSFVVLPIFPAIAPVFSAFLTTPGFSAPFLPIPLLIFNTALTVAANFVAGGNLAVAQHRQQVDHRRNEGRIRQLESREPMVLHSPAPSRHVQHILDQGPRTSHAEAAKARSNETSQPTLH